VTADVGDLLRDRAPTVLAALVRRFGDFAVCEDAVQEALATAATRWPTEGLPRDPTGWLITVASRRRTEALRQAAARQRRERATAALAPPEPTATPGADDTLTLLPLCCHPALTPPSQVAVTLRAVGGLTTAEIARAFLVSEATIAQRISRAKKRIRDTGARFTLPPEERSRRIGAALNVLYLIFNEGHTASSGDELTRVDLTTEAIRLTREMKALVPDDGEVAGLLALMLLTDARRPARTAADGSLVPLAEQDRSTQRSPANTAPRRSGPTCWNAPATAPPPGTATGGHAAHPEPPRAALPRVLRLPAGVTGFRRAYGRTRREPPAAPTCRRAERTSAPRRPVLGDQIADEGEAHPQFAFQPTVSRRRVGDGE
jgi:RNA polymerase sigma factor (sigma-70 family)